MIHRASKVRPEEEGVGSGLQFPESKVRQMRDRGRSLLRTVATVALLLSAGVGPVAAPPGVPTGDRPRLPLGEHLDLLQGPANAQDYARVSIMPASLWTKGSAQVIALGYGRSPQWVRFRLDNEGDADEDLLLEVAVPWMDSVQLYHRAHGSAAAGDRLPFANRDIGYRNVVFRLHIPARQRILYYARFENQGTMMIPLVLWQPAAFERARDQEQLLMGVYFGAGLIMALFNAFLFGAVRDRVYAHFVIFQFVVVVWMTLYQGYWLQFLIPDAPELAHRLPIAAACLMLLSGIGFARSFLQTKTRSPTGHRVLVGLQVVIGLGVLPATLFYGCGSLFISVLALATPLVLVPISIGLLRTSYRPARFFLISWAAILLAAFAAPLRSLGVFGSTLADYAVPIGSFLQMSLLSLALADRINELRLTAQGKQSEVERLHEATRRFVPQFARYLSPQPAGIALGQSIDLTATVMFSDIRGFTALSASMPSKDVVRFLNAYFQRLEPIIAAYGGFIDKHIGDSILAIFPENPDSAVRAAISALYELEAYNELRKRIGFLPVRTCFGIHTGPLTIGSVGSSERMELTVLGDTVNTAAMTEQLTKQFHARILLTDAAHKFLHGRDEFALREVAYLLPKGKSEHMAVYECFENDPVELRAGKLKTQGDLLLGLSLLRAGQPEQAQEAFLKASRGCPGDPVAVHNLMESLAAQDNAPRIPGVGKSVVLIVDDNPVIADLLRVRLRGRGVELQAVPSAVEALRALARRGFRAVIIDLNLPDIQGLELIGLVRDSCVLPPTSRIFVLSADDYPATRASVEAQGARFFPKPSGFDDLVAAIAESHAP